MIVQQMVPSERSGVLFTVDPSTGDPNHMVIEAAFGQGEVVVSGMVEPDTYLVAKDPLALLHVRMGRKSMQIVRGPDGTDLEVAARTRPQATARVLSDDEVLASPALGLAVEQHYGRPQDVEWALAGRPDLPGPVAAHHYLGRGRRTPEHHRRHRRRRGGHAAGARERPGRLRRAGVGAGAGAVLHERVRSPPARRDPGRAHDEPRLGARSCGGRPRWSPTGAA